MKGIASCRSRHSCTPQGGKAIPFFILGEGGKDFDFSVEGISLPMGYSP
jgi:hypothetical protein